MNLFLVTENLLRKSSEHNDGMLSTLEELALHQRDIERIEWLDKWCRELKILDLTSNLIPKIENLSRLKKLEYLKLGLNNIEEVENLEGCESLKKLDLTVNFINKLTSIESLKNNNNLEELYLVGNPCTQFEHYRSYVIATLPQLAKLDGIEITKTERIIASQLYEEAKGEIINQQKRNLLARVTFNNFSVIYIYFFDINFYRKSKNWKKHASNDAPNDASPKDAPNDDVNDDSFWSKPSEYTPESRILIYEHKQKMSQTDQRRNEETKKVRKLVAEDGRRLNINEPKLKFTLTEDVEKNNLVLDIALFRFLDSKLCEVDVQPTYVQVIVNTKIFQLSLPDDVVAEKSKAERSLVTGHLVITMPRV
ncbi:hypothetical protein HELRODRAFT_89170 [Helobdella robusta]|uniref:U2A'/phosphoprotein 32 family A C-terminal domain-containing protein n=1 Tax=Helobdella robusta TaxID=6412 RepID=T1G795_HELRO|nr:hypothetical protein HELRODRAFT_89170 [Helobdella robusta]ESN93211.1 hypothetical protein HELRODRAFT_89170 [Helobdella robusta]